MDMTIEQEIVAKGKTGQRVTREDIEAYIASEHYFTAEDGRWREHHSQPVASQKIQ